MIERFCYAIIFYPGPLTTEVLVPPSTYQLDTFHKLVKRAFKKRPAYGVVLISIQIPGRHAKLFTFNLDGTEPKPLAHHKAFSSFCEKEIAGEKNE